VEHFNKKGGRDQGHERTPQASGVPERRQLMITPQHLRW
jgi:hypothetical protein